MPVLGAPGINSSFQFLQGDLTTTLFFSLFVIVSAGFCEELVFRGFGLFQFEKWIKNRIWIVLISAILFGIPHFIQGDYGVIQAFLMGLFFGVAYYANNRNIWLLVVIHASFDLLSVFLIYHGLEESVATFLMK